MKKYIAPLIIIIAITLLITIDPALAGPGGKFARTIFDSFWGKVALVALTIIISPFLIYVIVQERMAYRRTVKDLRFMALNDPSLFDWLTIKQRTKDCFTRIHLSWEEEDLSEASKWMTDWYWQNQQITSLNKWKKEGLINICKVRKIKKITPLLFLHKNDGAEHANSMLVISITARMKDYLKDKETGKLIEGHRHYKDVETLWTFTLIDNVWKVSDIDIASDTLEYTEMAKNLPDIKETLIKNGASTLH